MIKVRLSDWRDRHDIQKMREMLKRNVDGGLWELLNWPVFHVHTAVEENGQSESGDPIYTTVGMTSVYLCGDGAADDMGSVVMPEHRGLGIGGLMKASQVRDLILMGWNRLYSAVKVEDQSALEWHMRFFDTIVNQFKLEDNTEYAYFRTDVYALRDRLKLAGVPEPIPLKNARLERIYHKAKSAREQLEKMKLLGEFTSKKAFSRLE